MYYFFLAFTISFITLLIVMYFSHKHTFFIDCHETYKPQKFHESPVPRAGGIGIVVAMLMLLSIPLGWKILLPAVLAFISGIFEDFHNSLSAKVRLVMQGIAALVAVLITGSVVTYLGLGIILPYWIGVLFSIFAIVGMTNAINIIDGFNGLASGVILMIILSFGVVSWQHHNMEMLHILSVIGGATLGFFILVFPKGKIFLGDGGAYLLGFIVALIGIFLAGRYNDVSPWYILAIFIYPVWEVVFSIVRKTSTGLSPMKPDNFHFHMLVYRQITKNNPLTALMIVVLILPFAIISTIYANCSICNIYLVVLFCIFYSAFYVYLYIKDTKTK